MFGGDIFQKLKVLASHAMPGAASAAIDTIGANLNRMDMEHSEASQPIVVAGSKKQMLARHYPALPIASKAASPRENGRGCCLTLLHATRH